MASNFDFPNSSFEQKASGDDRREESVQELTREQRHLLLQVFPELSSVKSDDPRKDVGFPALSSFLDSVLDKQSEEHKSPERVGFLGPQDILFDITANVGTLLVEADRLGVASHSNFCTIRANGCVFKGKWIYEVMLGSKGVMQLGWSTINCTFSQEEGVGDTANSYAYDGNRLRKWNVKTQRYGQGWLTGDIISCGIDCDEGTVTFFRNGQSMGTAFSNIRLGREMAYFPSVSLSFGENIRVNFGATPLKYPIEGYRALQAPPTVNVTKAWTLLSWVDRLLPLIEKENQQPSVALVPEALPLKSEGRSRKATLLLVMGHVFEKLVPLLTKAYVVEECLLKYLLRNCHPDDVKTDNNRVIQMLNMLWMYAQEFELKPCLEYLAIGLLAGYRFSPITTDFTEQRKYLTLLLVILRHADIRKHLLKFVLFDKIKFPIFMHVKPADDTSLLELIPEVWWAEVKEDDNNEEDEDLPAEPVIAPKQKQYLDACEALRKRVKELEDIQVEILSCLMIDNDGKRGAPNTRFIFLQKFKEFLKENMTSGRVHPVQQCPLPVILCLFHRMIRLLRSLWDDHATRAASRGLVSSDKAHVAEWCFADDSVTFVDIQRFGGVMSHLKKEHKELLQKCSEHRSRSDLQLPPTSLLELLDGTIMLFDIGAYKQLGKMATLHDTMKEYVLALQDTQSKIDRAAPEMTEVLAEVNHAKSVFLEKSAEQARQRAWLIAVVYSKEKQLDVQWIMETAMRTIENATVFFPFIPEYYIEVCINAYNALKHYFNPIQPFRALEHLDRINEEFARFLAKHFANNQIVNTDTRDNIVQALACFICYKRTLSAVENMQPKLIQDMVHSLITPYENRSWAQTNWILVRLWKGNGFAFRYIHLPHLIPAKSQAQDIANASLQKPHPSLKLQDLLGKELLSNEEAGCRFIDSVLNQLNWAFSEFIGMLQELQTIAARPERNIVDPRQLKICATCFDISVGLLRVLEMVVAKVPQLFLDKSKVASESLLTRLLQLLCQVMNRVTAKGNLFENIVSAGMPGLESVDHFPVLAAVCGVLVQLLGARVPPDRREAATSALLNEPGFQMSSVEFLLGGTPGQATVSASDKRNFSLRKYQEVSSEEIKEVEEMISHLKKCQISRERKSSFSEGEECTICYAHSANCVFQPCKHVSCRSCISQHLMSHKECFFCKSTITKVLDNNGKVVPIKSGKS
ncbi:E3 ubiquitin-protein ligase RNF123 [Lingula anatina]|uniref:E3 ubiquitin-protein ligase RNF123 n=1 Tax=Lingula anatina TaxID=7574 RepID=A0A1S3KH47_LINAN|nr:E3 ubiquitin-protein ligase RNF123 [Lingula anatina]|eukprot:XP_013421955.1 E3 ubiquitin-protein ligase RNF123 [Lingula anatina]